MGKAQIRKIKMKATKIIRTEVRETNKFIINKGLKQKAKGNAKLAAFKNCHYN